jgi:hypothetical protein
LEDLTVTTTDDESIGSDRFNRTDTHCAQVEAEDQHLCLDMEAAKITRSSASEEIVFLSL